jgi:AraC family ethanolamine operon transcriptional activator
MNSVAHPENAPDDGLFEISNSIEEVNERNARLGWNVQYLQLKPRGYEGRMAGMNVGESILLAEKINAPTEIVGEFQGDNIGVFFASTLGGRGVFAQNHDFCSSAFLLNQGGEVDFITSKNTQIGQLYINTEMFYRSWEMLAPGVDPFQFGYYGFVSQPSGFGQTCYRDILRFLRGDYATEQMKEEYISYVLAVLAEHALSNSPLRHQRPQAAARARLLARARDYIETHLAEPIRLPELCAHAGASISSLSRIFREYYGMAPAAYIRWRRMHECRRWLQQTESVENSVGEIIKSCGIKHPGRFANEYQRFFGETPKQTLGYRAR